MERWKTVAENKKYEVSDLGRVRRISTNRVLRIRLSKNGYPRVNFGDTRFVHRLVAIAFLKPDPSRPTVNHLNGEKTDNRAVNLAWSTLVENNAHSAHKRHASTNPKRALKLTLPEVLKIRKAHADGELTSVIAMRFDVSASMIRHIVYRRMWNTPDIP
jgi:hypothetical protein